MSRAGRAFAGVAGVSCAVLALCLTVPTVANAADPTPYPSGTVTGTPVAPPTSSSPSGTSGPSGTTSSGTNGGGSVTGGSLVAGATLSAGESVSLTVRVNPGDVVNLTIFSKSYDIATKKAGSDGVVAFSFRLPSGLACGDHHAVVRDVTQDRQISDIPFSVTCSSSGSSTVGGTADTGVAVGVIAGVGALCLLGGAFLLFAGRRRRTHA